MQKELTEVVDLLRHERSNTEVVCELLLLWLFELGRVDAGEIEQRIFVVVEEGALGGVVVGVDAVEGGVDDGLDRVELLEDLFCFVKGGARAFEVLRDEAKLDAGYFNGGVDVGVLAVFGVDF